MLSTAAGQRLAGFTVKTLHSIRNEECIHAPREMLNRPNKTQLVIIIGRSSLKLDNSISSIKERFNQPAFIVYASLEMVLLKAAKGEDNSKEIEDLTNVNSLTAQLSTFRLLVKDVDLKRFQDILKVVTRLERLEQHLIDQRSFQ